MGTKYGSGVSVSGYNANPPSDDGSTTESNKVKWSTHKTKLTDPIKTALESINTALVTALDASARAVSASDTAAASDHEKTIQVTSASVVITLSDAATMAAGYKVTIANQSTGNISVALATSSNTIDTVTNAAPVLSAKEVREYIVNAAATGYITKNGVQIPFTDSNPVVVGSSDNTKKVRFEVDGLTTGTTRVITVPDSDITLPIAATQADQETSTSTTTYVPPGRQQYHPSAVKAEGYITAPTTVTRSYPAAGVSVTNPGTGQYVVTHGVTFSGSTYSIAISAGTTLRTHRIDAQTATTFTVAFFDSSGVAAAATTFSYMCCGDLA